MVVTPHLVGEMWGFQDQMARILTGRLSWQSLNGRWENTLAEASRAEAERAEERFEIMEICRIQSPSILQRDIFLTYVRRRRVSRGKRWVYGSGNRRELNWMGKG